MSTQKCVHACCRLLLAEKRLQLGSQATKLRGGLTKLAETGQQVRKHTLWGHQHDKECMADTASAALEPSMSSEARPDLSCLVRQLSYLSEKFPAAATDRME